MSVAIATEHWSPKLSVFERPNVKIHELFNTSVFQVNSAQNQDVKKKLGKNIKNIKIYTLPSKKREPRKISKDTRQKYNIRNKFNILSYI